MIFIGMNHPKHFWMFKNIIEDLNKKQKLYKILVSEKDVLAELLNEANFPYIKLGVNKKGMHNKILQFIWYFLKTLALSIKYKPKIFIGQALPHFAFASFFIIGSKFYILEDTEHVLTLHKITVPFCTKIFTPKEFPNKFGNKQVYISSFYELLYLHPNNFKPDPFSINKIGFTKEDKFIIIRLVSWNAHHDKNEWGIDNEFLKNLIIICENNKIKLLISSERKLENCFLKHLINIPPSIIHSLLYFAEMYIGEGATMAAEAALIGTPSVYINTLNVSYCKELADEYNLIYNYRNTEGVIKIIENLLSNNHLKEEHKKRLKKLLLDKIDPVDYFIKLLSI